MDTVKNQQESFETRKGDWIRITIIFFLLTLFKAVLGFLLLLVILNPALIAQENDHLVVFEDGEELRYRVSWTFIRLGTVVIRQRMVDAERYTISLEAESDPRLPFIDVYFVNESIISTHPVKSLEFRSTLGRDRSKVFVHQLDSSGKTLHLTEYRNGVEVDHTVATLEREIHDDPSLFMFIRLLSGSGKQSEVISVMEGKLTRTVFTFFDEAENVDLAIVDNALGAHRFEGKADWSRPDYAGLKGEFTGWVSCDSARIPLRIEAKIFLGSIVLELESYKRAGWTLGGAKITQSSR